MRSKLVQVNLLTKEKKRQTFFSLHESWRMESRTSKQLVTHENHRSAFPQSTTLVIRLGGCGRHGGGGGLNQRTEGSNVTTNVAEEDKPPLKILRSASNASLEVT